MNKTKILLVGDIVGRPGRETLKRFLDKNKDNYDLVIVNSENSANGFGLTGKLADELLSWGCDVLTSGNHIWDKREIYEYLDGAPRALRPLNYPPESPGRGYVVVEDKKKNKIAVVSLQGRVFMPPTDCPFQKIREAVDEIRTDTKLIIIDFHAEATSEKLAMAWYLDGYVSLVAGTHTHVQTADNKILPEGTGYITDIGMTGSDNGIIGMSTESVLPKFMTAMPQKFLLAEGKERINAIVAEINVDTGECISIERLNKSLIEIELS
ncbi:MAG: TIGR00282 family metallophosphoesterase [Fusobacteriaceae bacterium]|nr:TIGR00282 family metallophosphoesterase [Fusobacteriaceae bacterium]